jgi:hypothetical protein
VNSVPLQVLLYAIVAGASPVALGAALAVLGSRGGRWNGIAFAAGVVLGQVVVFGLAAALGWSTLPIGDDAEVLRAICELVFGVALLVAGGVVWSRPPSPTQHPSPRTRAVMERLARLNAPEVFVAGAALAVGPKRLALTLLVSATITSADLGAVEGVVLGVVYVVVATGLVVVPVVLAVVFGDRAQAWMTDVHLWLAAHKRALTVAPLMVLGMLVVVDAVVGLL